MEQQYSYAARRPQGTAQRRRQHQAGPQGQGFMPPGDRTIQRRAVAQRVAINDDPGLELEADEMGAKAASLGTQLAAQRQKMEGSTAPVQRQPGPESAPANGLPSQLKAGIESMSGMGMDDVRVHYNSAKPAQLNAHAYAQGSDIHLASGQEQHLPHEAWHVVQQKQGRVKPTMEM